MNAPFYQSAATAFLAFLGAGIYAESRDGLAVADTGSKSVDASLLAGPGPSRSERVRRFAREASFVLVLSLMLGAGEIVCLLALSSKTERGWQHGIVSYTLILGVILTISSATGAVLARRLPDLTRNGRRKLEFGLAATLATVPVTLLMLNTIRGHGFGSFSLSLPRGYYLVHGTCPDGKCGLTERSAPSRSGHPTGKIFAEHELVRVVCQAQGDRFTGGSGSTSSAVWDKLADGGYVTDAFVQTPGKGTFSPGIKRCGSTSG